MLVVAKIRMKENISFRSHAKGCFWIRAILWDYLLLFGSKPPKPCLHRPTTNLKAKVHSQFIHGSRKIGQAAGAGGLKQDRYVHICDIRPRICGLRLCLSLSDWFADASARSGGKGTVRRKIVRKSKPSNTQDDKKLQGALKKLNVQPITGVEEVNMFREDGNVLHFSAPKGGDFVSYCIALHRAVSDFVWGYAARIR
jgi:hypothetical protein